MKKTSYISTTVLPFKMVSDVGIIQAAKEHALRPVHVKINPTNTCPMKCEFCSFKNMDRNVEIDYKQLCLMIDELCDLGMRAVTLTGGGDPLAYSHINDLIDYLYVKKITIGIVTNGLLINNVLGQLHQVKWCRISLSDYKTFDADKYAFIKGSPQVDWSFSYLVSSTPNVMNIMKVLVEGEKLGLTHIRFADDATDPASSLDAIRPMISHSRLAVLQSTKNYTRGATRCLASLLKPGINPYGELIPCCGVSYATNPPTLNWDACFQMGNNIKDIYQNQRYFDGSVCDRCFQGEHNDFLNALWDSNEIDHKDFV